MILKILAYFESFSSLKSICNYFLTKMKRYLGIASVLKIHSVPQIPAMGPRQQHQTGGQDRARRRHADRGRASAGKHLQCLMV